MLEKLKTLCRESLSNETEKEKNTHWLRKGFLLVCISIYTGLVMLQLANGQYPIEVLSGYFQSPAILVMNTIPAVLLILFFYGIFGRAWLAYIL